MNQRIKSLTLLIGISVISTIFLWLPFFSGLTSYLGFKIPPGGMKTILANYDGPNYIIIAKTWYQKNLIAKSFSLPLPLEYYPAHFPGYPLLIWFFGQLINFPRAMLLVTLSTSALSVVIFYLFLDRYKLSTNPFWLSLIFLFMPARILVIRSIGAPESLFILAILASFYFFKKKSFWLAGLFGAIAQITKTPAILLFLAYIIYFVYLKYHQHKLNQSGYQAIKEIINQVLPLILIPMAAIAVFTFYWWQTGDFLAYFHSGDNFHLTAFPFQSFYSNRSWLGDIWLEDIIWLYLVSAIGVILLFKRKLVDIAIFSLIFYLATIFIAHRDISRYSLALWPFLLIGLDPLLQKKEFKIAFFLILPAIYLYALNFVLGNQAPIGDWTFYL